MKKALKIIGITLLSIVVLIIVVFQIFAAGKAKQAKELYAQLGEEVPVISVDGESYRDLNKNGNLDVYEDSRADIEDRISDLIGQMTLEEKAGTMFVSVIGMTSEGDPVDKPRLSRDPFDIMIALAVPPASEMLVTKKLNSYNILNAYDADIMGMLYILFNTLHLVVKSQNSKEEIC